MDVDEQVAWLRSENVALRSLLCGLCVGLSRMSEVHREIVAQAFDMAHRFAAPDSASGAAGNGPGQATHADVIGDLRRTVIGHQGEPGHRL